MINRPTGAQREQDFNRLPQQALWVLLAFVVFGIFVILAYAVVVPGKFLAIAGVGIMTAGASLFTGGLFGFLFGIPRTATPEAQSELLPARTEYRPNTNLEQISDWLTKILVGVGLTQIIKLPAALASVSDYFERTQGLGTWPGNGIFGLAIMLTYLICGFLIGYLWTYLFMRIALAFQEYTIKFMNELRAQSDMIAEALGLVDQQLNPPGGQVPIDREKLKSLIRQLPPETLVDIFSRARQKRREGWFDDKKRAGVVYAVPVFEALIAAIDPREEYQYYSELGFALKDQDPPEWARAEKALGDAIRVRNVQLPDWKSLKWPSTLEANRAVCRIKMDPNFAQGVASTEEVRKGIVEDLRLAMQGGMNWLFNEDKQAPAWSKDVYLDILKWMELNGITLESLG